MSEQEKKLDVVHSYIVQRPPDHILYKGRSVLQFTLKPAEPVKSGNYIGTKKGVVFVAAAPIISKNNYDWDKKVTIGLNEHEVGQFIYGLKGKEEVKFYHDRYKGTDKEGQEIKNMTISPSDKGTVFVNISQSKDGERQIIPGVPIVPAEAITLSELLRKAILRVTGW